MKRRAFILALGGAAAWPLAARAQREPARIAFLGSGAAASSRIFLDAFKQGLGDHGMIEGRGAKPADLPVEQPTRIELSLNMKTAKALRIILPESLLVRADRIIE